MKKPATDIMYISIKSASICYPQITRRLTVILAYLSCSVDQSNGEVEVSIRTARIYPEMPENGGEDGTADVHTGHDECVPHDWQCRRCQPLQTDGTTNKVIIIESTVILQAYHIKLPFLCSHENGLSNYFIFVTKMSFSCTESCYACTCIIG